MLDYVKKWRDTRRENRRKRDKLLVLLEPYLQEGIEESKASKILREDLSEKYEDKEVVEYLYRSYLYFLLDLKFGNNGSDKKFVLTRLGKRKIEKLKNSYSYSAENSN